MTSYWPLALVRRVDRLYYAETCADHQLLADVCQQLYTLGYREAAEGVVKIRTVNAAIRLVLTSAGMRRRKNSRRWAVPPVDVVAYAAANSATMPRRAWHAKGDRRRTWSPQEVAVLEAARHRVGYQRVADMLGRSRDQVIAWYRRREGRRTR